MSRGYMRAEYPLLMALQSPLVVAWSCARPLAGLFAPLHVLTAAHVTLVAPQEPTPRSGCHFPRSEALVTPSTAGIM